METRLIEEMVKLKRTKIGKLYRSDKWHNVRKAVL